MINEMGGMNLVVTQLQLSTNSPLLFSYCCFSLGNLCLTINDENGSFSSFIRDENVINLLLQTLQNNMNDWQLVQQICFALGNIIFVADFEESILSQNGVQIVLDAVLKHRSNPCTVDAVFFLKNLSYGELARNTIIQNDGVMKLLCILEQQISNSDFCQVAIGLLFDLTFSGATQVLVQSNLGLKLLFHLIEQHSPHDYEFMSQSMKFLQRLYQTADHAGQITLISLGLVELIEKLNVPKNIAHDIFLSLSDIPPCPPILPTESVPSLKELAARKTQTLDLPEDLQTYLKTKKSCSSCGSGFFEHFYQQLGTRPIEGFTGLVPVMLYSCSRHCFEKLNNKTSQ